MKNKTRILKTLRLSQESNVSPDCLYYLLLNERDVICTIIGKLYVIHEWIWGSVLLSHDSCCLPDLLWSLSPILAKSRMFLYN